MCVFTAPINGLLKLQRDAIKGGKQTLTWGLDLQNTTVQQTAISLKIQAVNHHQRVQLSQRMIHRYLDIVESSTTDNVDVDVDLLRALIDYQYGSVIKGQSWIIAEANDQIDEAVEVSNDFTEIVD